MKKTFIIVLQTFLIVILLLIIIIIRVLNDECVVFSNRPTNLYINGLGTRLSLNPSEVMNINYSFIKPQLEIYDFGIKNLSNQSPYYRYRDFFIFNPLNKIPVILLYVEIYLETKNASNTSYMEVSYVGVYPETELDTRITLVKSQLNLIAIICNLTLNWRGVQWSISYQD